MDFMKMMQQAKKMQEQVQKEVRGIREEASSGGGAVTVTLDGNKRMMAVKISPEAIQGGDVEMLEDLVLTATNEAARRVDEAVSSRVAGLTGGLNIPGIF